MNKQKLSKKKSRNQTRITRPLDKHKIECYVRITNTRERKRIEKIAENFDYWKRFTLGSRTFIKSFQNVLEIKMLYRWEYNKLKEKQDASKDRAANR